MTNKITQSLLVLAVGGLMSIGSAAAQTQTSAGQKDSSHARVTPVKRDTRQSKSADNGVKNAKLTTKHTAHTQTSAKSPQKREKKSIAKSTGHPTRKDQGQLKASNTSKSTSKDKQAK